MPTGPGFFYSRQKGLFEVKTMLQSGKQGSRQALEWLEFEQARCPYPDQTIKHAYNFGEQEVAGFFVDGFISIPNGDGSFFTVAYEFLGCHWHFCPWHCCETKKTEKDGQEDQQRLWKIEQAVDRLIVKRGCEWARERNFWINTFESKHFCFIHEQKITEEKVLEWIRLNKFFGIVRADVRTPPEVVEKLKHLNFPFVFRKFEVTEEMLSEKMKKLASENGKIFPMVTRTLTWNADDIILTTDMVNFYNEIGIKVENIRWGVQYIPSKPFTKFVNLMVGERIQAFIEGNAPLGERAKLCLNSCVGRFGLVE